MFKVFLFISLAVASACAQNLPAGPPGSEAAPEPYSYGYETESHSAAEQKDPNGRVTGYYTLSDADGRTRRVEYYADESGFHAKVQTNEVGTESKNSADVEVLASPPTREQLVYQPPAAQPPPPPPQPQRVASVERVVTSAVSQPARVQQSVSYAQQPGYAQYGAQYGYGYYPNGYNAQYGYGQGYNGVYSSYNNHLPSQYYKSVQQTVGTVQPASYSSVSVQPAKYTTGVVGVQPVAYSAYTSGVQPSSYTSGVVTKYSVANPVVGAAGAGSGSSSSSSSSYRSSSGYQSVGVPAAPVPVPAGVQYSSYRSSVVSPQKVGYSQSVSGGYSSSSNPVGSSNYILLKKRDSSDADQSSN